MAGLIPERVGSPLSLNALREDLEVSHRGITHWMDVLERLYHVVRIRPFESSRVRSLRKMPKAYLWDWSQVAAPGPRLENMVAMHLLKLCHFLRDHDGYDVELGYLRDRTGKEVDFVVTFKGRPWMVVEVKVSDTAVDCRRPIPDLFPRSVEDSLRLPGRARGSSGHDRSRCPRGTCPRLPGRSTVTVGYGTTANLRLDPGR